jgi:hypothetical protein
MYCTFGGKCDEETKKIVEDVELREGGGIVSSIGVIRSPLQQRAERVNNSTGVGTRLFYYLKLFTDFSVHNIA